MPSICFWLFVFTAIDLGLEIRSMDLYIFTKPCLAFTCDILSHGFRLVVAFATSTIVWPAMAFTNMVPELAKIDIDPLAIGASELVID